MKENTPTAQTLSVCLDSAALDTGKGRDCVIAVVFCGTKIFYFFSPPLSFASPHTLGMPL